jgi:hypothetical protein
MLATALLIVSGVRFVTSDDIISSVTLSNRLANCELADLVRCRLHSPRYQARRIPRSGRYGPDLPRCGAGLAILQQTSRQVVAGRLRVRSRKQGKSINCMARLGADCMYHLEYSYQMPNAASRRSL